MTDLVYYRDTATGLQITNQIHLERHPFRDEVCEGMHRLPKTERDVVEKLVTVGLLQEHKSGFYISEQISPAEGQHEFLKTVEKGLEDAVS